MRNSVIGRYVRTLLHHRPSQIVLKALRQCERALPTRWTARLYRQPPAELRPPDFQPPLPPPPGSRWGSAEIKELELGRFRFLHEERSLGRHTLQWYLGPARQGRLWIVNLHYHEWAFRLAEASLSGESFAPSALRLFEEYLADWLTQCSLEKPGSRHLAWNPYVIATRLGWWIRSLRLLQEHMQKIDSGIEAQLLRSLAVQACYLDAHVEWETRANHLLRDALGLAWAGACLKHPKAKKWLQHAGRILEQEVPRQFLPDGGHYERSPMYHSTVVHDLIHLAALLKPFGHIQEMLRTVIPHALEWLAWMRHPDADICLFNDAALSLAPSWKYLCDAAQVVGLPLPAVSPRGFRHFPDTGMVVWHGQPWTVFFDVGEVGPGEQPGHAHADTLSIECSLNGHRLIVDPGTFHYDPDPIRDQNRSTAAHNTVCVDGANSSEVWGLFRVGRMAHVRLCSVSPHTGGFVAEAEHDGYRFLFGTPRHSRKLQLRPDHSLLIVDRVTGRGEHRVEGGFLLGPGWNEHPTSEGWLVQGPGGKIRIRVTGVPPPELETQPARYYPTFGIQRNTSRLVWRVQGRLPVEVTTIVAI